MYLDNGIEESGFYVCYFIVKKGLNLGMKFMFDSVYMLLYNKFFFVYRVLNDVIIYIFKKFL